MKKMSKPIVFFGNEKLATGIPTPEPIILKAVQTVGFEIEQHVTGKLSELRPHQAKLAVLAAYGRIIPQSIIDQFPLGIINVHPSLLPKYRGPTPIEQALLDGVGKTGVSIMHLTAGMDEGPVYKQKALHLSGRDSKEELTGRLQQLGSKLLIEILPTIAEGKLKPRSQPHPVRATYSHLLTKQDGIIDWDKSAEVIERQIRAFLGWPGSRTTLAGKEVIITRCHITSESGEAGQIKVSRKELVVYCGNNALVIDKLKPAGKKEMTAGEFISGYLK